MLDLDAPVPVGLSLLLSQSLDNGHRDPQDCNPSEWNGECVDNVLNVEFVGVALKDIDRNLQRGIDKGVNNHAKDTQDNK